VIRNRKVKKGLSNSLVAIIVVITALVVGGLVFEFPIKASTVKPTATVAKPTPTISNLPSITPAKPTKAVANIPSITQVGTGVLLYNPKSEVGEAKITLQSNESVKIVSAQIVGTNYTALSSVIIASYNKTITGHSCNGTLTNITLLIYRVITPPAYYGIIAPWPGLFNISQRLLPISLTVGNNSITLFFYGFIPKPGETYTIELALSNGQTVLVKVVAEYVNKSPPIMTIAIIPINGPGCFAFTPVPPI